MASFVGAITEFNPYIQQIPTEAYTKVGMFKEQMYASGVEKTQDAIDKIAGLDIANEGGRQYLRARVDELTKTLNKYSQIDFSNPNNVSQLTSLAKPLYQDENIVNDVINTGIYRKWAKEASDAYKSGKMELGQYMRETTDANVWLNSQSAGAQYTGRSNANTATKKDLVDRVIKAKKDGIDKNEYVYDKNYSMDTPYYVKSTNKYYSEADFNNFVANNIMSTRDREMLMNDNWYENQGKPTQQLQLEDLQMYQAKIDANTRRINQIIHDPLLYAGDRKAESQQVINDLKAYNDQLINGKVKYLQGLNLNDPNSRDVFHRDLSESRFISSLSILRDETKKEEYQKNEQWFLDKQLEIEFARKLAAGTATKPKTIEEATNEVAVYTPVSPTAPKTELSLNTVQRGWQIKNEEINGAMNGLIGKLQENGVDMNQFISGWDQVQVGNKSGASMNVPRFKNEDAKKSFYNLVSGLNFAYTMEAQDGSIDNKSFTKWVKTYFSDFNDDDPNSTFTFPDKMVSNALNTLKGTSALLPRLENLFSDKGVVRTMAQVDEALKNKKDMANVYREALYKSGALNQNELQSLSRLSDEDLLSSGYNLNSEREKLRAGKDKKVSFGVVQEKDGTFSIYKDVYDNKDAGAVTKFLQNLAPEYGTTDIGLGAHLERTKLQGGYTDKDVAENTLRIEGNLKATSGISKQSLDKAEEYVRQTYSYVQENLNSTVQNLKNDKAAYSAVQDGLTLFLNRARLQSSSDDISIEDGSIDPRSVSGISKVEVLGGSVNNSEDIFNPNPVYEVQFTGTVNQGTKEEKTSTYNAKVSLKSFLATNPDFRNSEYAKYFAPMLYAQQDAYARIKSSINPLEGSEASYARRNDINPVYSRINQQDQVQFAQDDPTGNTASGGSRFGNQIQWETLPIERDGRQTMVSFQVVSLGQNTVLGNAKNKDGNQYAPGAYYVKLKVPTSTGEPKVIFLKKPNGDSYVFNNASNAYYTVKDLIFNNNEMKFDEVDPKTGQINYFSTDPTTLRGIFNSQLSYNGHSKLEVIKIKDALGKEITKQQAKELQFGSR